ncbi:Uncharacterised protein [Salmonella enterica subsp. enterica serovar Typhimurium str. DT104]|nr:Uncharacterised protein [Salmonella enterica subsp. enterica serovar Typhimurium str. DT104]
MPRNDFITLAHASFAFVLSHVQAVSILVTAVSNFHTPFQPIMMNFETPMTILATAPTAANPSNAIAA